MANDLSAFNAQAWSKRIIANIDQINQALQFANTDYEGEIQGVGDTVQVRTLGTPTVGAWSKGGTITYQDLAPTKEPMTISDAQYFAFKVDDVEKAQNDLSALDLYAQRAAVTLNNTVESKLWTLAATYAGTALAISNGGTAITLDAGTSTTTGIYQLIVKARTYLSKNNVPETGRWLAVDPDTTALLLQDTVHFIKAGNLGDAMVQNGNAGGPSGALGKIGRIAGFDVYESAVLYSNGGTVYMPYGQGNPISYAAQLREVEAIRLETTFASAVRGLLLHGGTVFAEDKKRLGYIMRK